MLDILRHQARVLRLLILGLPRRKHLARHIADTLADLRHVLEHSVTGHPLFSHDRAQLVLDQGLHRSGPAAILLDAQHPHRVAPALPGLTPTGHAGIFAEDAGRRDHCWPHALDARGWSCRGHPHRLTRCCSEHLRAEGPAVGTAGRR